MVNVNFTEVKATRVQQVGMVVEDVQKTIEAFWNILGIGPWAIFRFGQPIVPDLMYYGRPAWGVYKGAIAQTEPIELELFETIEGPSLFQDWIEERGEGIHHAKFLVHDLDVARVEKSMNEQGFPSIWGGHFGPNSEKHFKFFDTFKILRFIWETSNRSGGTPQLATFYPDDAKAKSPAKVKVSEINGIGITVKDVLSVVEDYRDILNIGPWDIYDLGPRTIIKRQYHGKSAWAREKFAHTFIGTSELELVQPVTGDSIHQDWIDKYGDGPQYLIYKCDDVDKVGRLFSEQGFRVIQSGHFRDRKAITHEYCFIDIPPLHCVLKAVKSQKATNK